MLVLDASALVEVLLQTPDAARVEARLTAGPAPLCAPHVIDLEVAQALRGLVAGGHLDAERGREALEDLADFPLYRYPHHPMLAAIWSRRGHLTAYDAAYLELAEALDCPLLTRDRRLARTGGRIERV